MCAMMKQYNAPDIDEMIYGGDESVISSER